MPIASIRCPSGEIRSIDDCLGSCVNRCVTLPVLLSLVEERRWTGVFSTTQLLNGTMMEFLRITKPYTIDLQDRVFILLGIRTHKQLERMANLLGLPAEVPLSMDRNIIDLLEWENGWVLIDYKVWGSYRVAKALGLKVVGRQPTGEVYKTSGKWGKAGTPKTVPVFAPVPEEANLFEPELQLNRYRILLKRWNISVSRMRLQVIVRDAGTILAKSRGVTQGLYLVPIRELDNRAVEDYFARKAAVLSHCLESGECKLLCDDRESWEGRRCARYCEVAEYCPRGKLQRKLEKKEDL